jgi:hypothetical protein
MPLTTALGELAGVKPKAARASLRVWHDQSYPVQIKKSGGLKSLQRRSIELTGMSLSPEDHQEMNHEDSARDGKTFISPLGAKVLIDLYEKGNLPVTKGSVSSVGNALAKYAENGESLKWMLERRAEEDRAVRAQYLRRLDGVLTEIPESELTISFLHDLFLHRKVSNGSLVIGGIVVQKQLSPSFSNSRRSKDWSESFSWEGSDGKKHSLQSGSRFDTNRSNDADRNWGLGRG